MNKIDVVFVYCVAIFLLAPLLNTSWASATLRNCCSFYRRFNAKNGRKAAIGQVLLIQSSGDFMKSRKLLATDTAMKLFASAMVSDVGTKRSVNWVKVSELDYLLLELKIKVPNLSTFMIIRAYLFLKTIVRLRQY